MAKLITRRAMVRTRYYLSVSKEEIQGMLDSVDLAATLLGFGVLLPAPANIIAGVIQSYLQANVWIITKAVKGRGFLLTITLPTMTGYPISPLIPGLQPDISLKELSEDETYGEEEIYTKYPFLRGLWS